MNAKVRKKYKKILNNLQEGTQIHKILKHLLEHGSITTFDAFKTYRITRLSGRIFELKELGVNIDSQIVYKKEKGNPVHYAVYTVK